MLELTFSSTNKTKWSQIKWIINDYGVATVRGFEKKV